MQEPEYIEGPEALENFKRLATALLQAAKPKGKANKQSKATSRKDKTAEKD